MNEVSLNKKMVKIWNDHDIHKCCESCKIWTLTSNCFKTGLNLKVLNRNRLTVTCCFQHPKFNQKNFVSKRLFWYRQPCGETIHRIHVIMDLFSNRSFKVPFDVHLIFEFLSFCKFWNLNPEHRKLNSRAFFIGRIS